MKKNKGMCLTYVWGKDILYSMNESLKDRKERFT